MKHNTKDRCTDQELKAVQALNADLNRTNYPQISTAPAVLAQVVTSCMQGRNPFQLCHQVAVMARKMHVPAHFCFTETITTAMRMLAQPVPKDRLRLDKRVVAA